jgi:hypothetical protein
VSYCKPLPPGKTPFAVNKYYITYFENGLFKTDPERLEIQPMEEEMLDDREDDGRIAFQMEQSNKSLP